MRKGSDERSMLVQARWPDPKKPFEGAADAPSWSSIFEKGKAWSGLTNGWHGEDQKKAGTGGTNDWKKGAGNGWKENGYVDAWITDGGGLVRDSEDLEYEQGESYDVEFENHGQGYLREQAELAGGKAAGAVLVINWGKSYTESGLVTKHDGDKLEFTVPCGIEKDFRYTSCSTRPFYKEKKGVEKGMASYFLTHKLELLTVEGEWHYEKAAGRIFVKLKGGAKQYKFFGRRIDLGLAIRDSPGITIRGLSFFASGLRIDKSPKAKVLHNSFAYPTYGPRALVDPSKGAVSQKEFFASGKDIKFSKSNGALIEGNVFNYSEGHAFQVYDSTSVVVRDNFLAWNMFHAFDDYKTSSFKKGGKGVAEFNTFYFNNGVGAVAGSPGGMREYGNWVHNQNFGELQHDGSALGAGGSSASNSVIDRNWVSDGHYSISVRFDAASETPLKGTTWNGTITRNVGWGSYTRIIAKGSQNTLSRNTLLGMPGDDSELQVVRDYHGVCMNEKSVVQDNLVGRVSGRGVEKEPCIMTKEDAEFLGLEPGREVTGLPEQTANNVELPYDEICAMLVDCKSKDFRPLAKDTPGAYAYTRTGDTDSYFIAGQRPAATELFAISRPALTWREDAALIFRTPPGCSALTVELCKGGKGSDESDEPEEPEEKGCASCTAGQCWYKGACTKKKPKKCKNIGGEVCGKGGKGGKRKKAVKSAFVDQGEDGGDRKAAEEDGLQLQVDRRSKSCSKKDLGPKNVWHLAMEENADYTWTASGCGAAEGSFTFTAPPTPSPTPSPTPLDVCADASCPAQSCAWKGQCKTSGKRFTKGECANNGGTWCEGTDSDDSDSSEDADSGKGT